MPSFTRGRSSHHRKADPTPPPTWPPRRELFADTDFQYVAKWNADHSAVLEFVADIDGIHVNGIDMIYWNDDGKITSVKVMLRPIKDLQAVIPEMGKLLQQGDIAPTGWVS